MRRKQTSIHFSRSALPYRYLRYISWISWVRPPRCQPSTSWVSALCSALCRNCAPFSRRCLCLKTAIATLLLLPLGRQNNYSLISPKKKKTSFFPSSPSLARLFLRYFAHKLFARATRAPIRGRSIARRPRRFLRPSHKQKMRARSIAPRTRSKKRRLLAQEKHT